MGWTEEPNARFSGTPSRLLSCVGSHYFAVPLMQGLSRLERTSALKMLAKWYQPTRLETRTKESNTYASRWVANLEAQ